MMWEGMIAAGYLLFDIMKENLELHCVEPEGKTYTVKGRVEELLKTEKGL